MSVFTLICDYLRNCRKTCFACLGLTENLNFKDGIIKNDQAKKVLSVFMQLIEDRSVFYTATV